MCLKFDQDATFVSDKEQEAKVRGLGAGRDLSRRQTYS